MLAKERFSSADVRAAFPGQAPLETLRAWMAADAKVTPLKAFKDTVASGKAPAAKKPAAKKAPAKKAPAKKASATKATATKATATKAAPKKTSEASDEAKGGSQ